MWMLYTYLIGTIIPIVYRCVNYGYLEKIDSHNRYDILEGEDNYSSNPLNFLPMIALFWPLYPIGYFLYQLGKLPIKLGESLAKYQLKRLKEKRNIPVKVIEAPIIPSCDNCGHPSKTGAMR